MQSRAPSILLVCIGQSKSSWVGCHADAIKPCPTFAPAQQSDSVLCGFEQLNIVWQALIIDMIDCIKHAECDTGFCDDGTCSAPGFAKPCKEGKCKDKNYKCHNERKVCVHRLINVFEPKNGTCDSNSDCPPDKYCSEKKCVLRNQPGSKCEVSSSSCIDGYTCAGGSVCRLNCDLHAKESAKFGCSAGEECTKWMLDHVGYCKPVKKIEKPKASESVNIEPIEPVSIEPMEPTKPMEPIKIEPIEPIKPMEPRHYRFSSTSSNSHNNIIIGIVGLVLAFVFVVIVAACVKCCRRRRRKPDQTTATVSPHPYSPTYGAQPTGGPMMVPMSPSAPPMMYSPHQLQPPPYGQPQEYGKSGTLNLETRRNEKN